MIILSKCRNTADMASVHAYWLNSSQYRITLLRSLTLTVSVLEIQKTVQDCKKESIEIILIFTDSNLY